MYFVYYNEEEEEGRNKGFKIFDNKNKLLEWLQYLSNCRKNKFDISDYKIIQGKELKIKLDISLEEMEYENNTTNKP